MTVEGWFLDKICRAFPAPWTIAPLDGKYYGTVILDKRGRVILDYWDNDGEDGHPAMPSRREKQTEEDLCDCHWESAKTLAVAERLIELRNDLSVNRGDRPMSGDSEEVREFFALLFLANKMHREPQC